MGLGIPGIGSIFDILGSQQGSSLIGSGLNMFSQLLGQGMSNIGNAELQRTLVPALQGQANQLQQAGQDQMNQFIESQGAVNRGANATYESAYNTLGDQLRGNNANILGQIQATNANMNNAFQGTADKLRGLLQGSGDQERKDINTRFDNAQSANMDDLQQRGLGNTTALAGTRGVLERQRSDSLGGLEERLRGQGLGVESGIGNTALNLAGQTGNAYTNALAGAMGSESNLLGQSLFGNADRALSQGSGLAQNVYNMGQGQIANTMNTNSPLYNFLAQTNIAGPSQANYLNTQGNLGQGSVQTSPPDINWLATLGGPIGGGLAAGGGAALGGALAGRKMAAAAGTMGAGLFFCVDADANIKTPSGTIPLRDIQVGTIVYDGEHNVRQVEKVDIGHTSPEQAGTFIRFNDKLTLTQDHRIEGRAASTYLVGQSLPNAHGRETIIKTEMVDPDMCGDIVLSGDGPQTYIANGVVVNSMLVLTTIEV